MRRFHSFKGVGDNLAESLSVKYVVLDNMILNVPHARCIPSLRMADRKSIYRRSSNFNTGDWVSRFTHQVAE